MNASADRWVARNMAAACVASRWLIGASLALTVVAAVLSFSGDPGRAASAALSLVVAAGAAQIYLAWRIEFDRRIFQLFAEAPDAAEAARGFERGLEALGHPRKGGERSLGERAAGLKSLVKKAAGILVLQIVLLIAASWLRH